MKVLVIWHILCGVNENKTKKVFKITNKFLDSVDSHQLAYYTKHAKIILP